MQEETNYELLFSEANGILEIVVAGKVTKNTIERLHTDILAILMASSAKAILCDVSDVEGFPDGFGSAYYRIRSLPKDIRMLHAAIVGSKIDGNYQSFHETAAANVGQSLKYFSTIEDARTWLKGGIRKLENRNYMVVPDNPK